MQLQERGSMIRLSTQVAMQETHQVPEIEMLNAQSLQGLKRAAWDLSRRTEYEISSSDIISTNEKSLRGICS